MKETEGDRKDGKGDLEGLRSRPGCGLVGRHGWRAAGVKLWILVNESSEGGCSFEFPFGTAVAEGRKNPLLRRWWWWWGEVERV